MPYQVVLRSCPEASQAAAAQAISQIFGVKDNTSLTVAQSVPIVLIDDLTEAEAASMLLAMRCLEMAGGELDFCQQRPDEELPRIEWPKRPRIFKRPINLFPAEMSIELPIDAERRVRLIDLLVARLTGTATDRGGYQPQSGSYAPQQAPVVDSSSSHASRRPFEGSDLGEITPFSNPILPPSLDEPAGDDTGIDGQQLTSRMDELFPDEESGSAVPTGQDITNAINQLLPDDDDDMPITTPAGGTSAGGTSAGGQFSVFLNKIADDNRREKVVPLLIELLGISEEQATSLSKKMIIPVLKNVSKQDAELAKSRFAEIGVLARVRS